MKLQQYFNKIKTLLIIIMFFLTSFIYSENPVIIEHISKIGGGIGGVFNRFEYVDITWTPIEISSGHLGYEVDVDCFGKGFNRCKVNEGTLPQIAPTGMTNEMFEFLMEEAAELELYSEQQAKDGDIEGNESTKIAVVDGDEIYYYLIIVIWEYEDENATDGEITIRIFETESL